MMLTLNIACGRMKQRGDSMDDGKRKVNRNIVLTDFFFAVDIIAFWFGWIMFRLFDDTLEDAIAGAEMFILLSWLPVICTFLLIHKGEKHIKASEYGKDVADNGKVLTAAAAIYSILSALFFAVRMIISKGCNIGVYLIWAVVLCGVPFIFVLVYFPKFFDVKDIKFSLNNMVQKGLEQIKNFLFVAAADMKKTSDQALAEDRSKQSRNLKKEFYCAVISGLNTEPKARCRLGFGDNEIMITSLGVMYKIEYDKICDTKLRTNSGECIFSVAYTNKDEIKYAVLNLGKNYKGIKDIILDLRNKGKLNDKMMSVELGDKDEPKNLVCEGCGSTEIERIGGVYVCPYCGRRRK